MAELARTRWRKAALSILWLTPGAIPPLVALAMPLGEGERETTWSTMMILPSVLLVACYLSARGVMATWTNESVTWRSILGTAREPHGLARVMTGWALFTAVVLNLLAWTDRGPLALILLFLIACAAFGGLAAAITQSFGRPGWFLRRMSYLGALICVFVAMVTTQFVVAVLSDAIANDGYSAVLEVPSALILLITWPLSSVAIALASSRIWLSIRNIFSRRTIDTSRA